MMKLKVSALLISIISALGFLSSLLALAAPKVVLLTSLRAPNSIWLTKSWNLRTDLEDIFHQAFDKSGYTVEVKHDATTEDLARELDSPENVGVFWVSHAASDSGDDSPVGLDSLIINEQGVDVSGVFQVIHPNLRYLAIVGCKAKPIFDQYTQNGDYKNNPNLHIHAFDTLVEAEPGMIESLNESLPYLADPNLSDTYKQIHYGRNEEIVPESEDSYIPTIVGLHSVLGHTHLDACPKAEGFPIQVTRAPAPGSKDPLVEVQFFVNEKFVGLMPQAPAGTTQTQTIYLPQGTLSSTDEMKIKVDSKFGGVLTTRPNFGNFTFSSALPQSEWKVFADASGKPIGVSNVLYRFQGSDSAIFSERYQKEYAPFACSSDAAPTPVQSALPAPASPDVTVIPEPLTSEPIHPIQEL